MGKDEKDTYAAAIQASIDALSIGMAAGTVTAASHGLLGGGIGAATTRHEWGINMVAVELREPVTADKADMIKEALNSLLDKMYEGGVI